MSKVKNVCMQFIRTVKDFGQFAGLYVKVFTAVRMKWNEAYHCVRLDLTFMIFVSCKEKGSNIMLKSETDFINTAQFHRAA